MRVSSGTWDERGCFCVTGCSSYGASRADCMLPGKRSGRTSDAPIEPYNPAGLGQRAQRLRRHHGRGPSRVTLSRITRHHLYRPRICVTGYGTELSDVITDEPVTGSRTRPASLALRCSIGSRRRSRPSSSSRSKAHSTAWAPCRCRRINSNRQAHHRQ
jgi:hypothetical protein